MKKLIFVILILLALAGTVSAVSDNFTIKTLYSPTNYIVDYGIANTAKVNTYWINSSKTLVANQSWYVLGSNTTTTVDMLDHRTAIAFTADVGQCFIIASPGYYRYYYFTLDTGFYDPATIIKLNLNTLPNYSSYQGSKTYIEQTPVTPIIPIIGIAFAVLLFIKKKD